MPFTCQIDLHNEYLKHKKVACSLRYLNACYFNTDLNFKKLFLGEQRFKMLGQNMHEKQKNDPTIPVYVQDYKANEIISPEDEHKIFDKDR